MGALQFLINEARSYLAEHEISVDEHGYAHDDEGNSWFVGKDWPADLYHGKEAYQLVMMAPKEPAPKLLSKEQTAQVAALNKALGKKHSKFLASIRDQLNKGKKLSPKQLYAVNKNLHGLGLSQDAALFKGAPGKSGVVTKGAEGQAAALRAALEKKDNKFLVSILQQVEAGKALSEKQLKAVRQNLYKLGMKKEADLFREPAGGKIEIKGAVKQGSPAAKELEKKLAQGRKAALSRLSSSVKSVKRGGQPKKYEGVVVQVPEVSGEFYLSINVSPAYTGWPPYLTYIEFTVTADAFSPKTPRRDDIHMAIANSMSVFPDAPPEHGGFNNSYWRRKYAPKDLKKAGDAIRKIPAFVKALDARLKKLG